MIGLLPKFSKHNAASLLAISAAIVRIWILANHGARNYLVDPAISFFIVAAIAYLVSLAIAFEKFRLQNPRTEFVWFASSAMAGQATGATALVVAIRSTLNYLVATCAPAVFTFNLIARPKFPPVVHSTARIALS